MLLNDVVDVDWKNAEPAKKPPVPDEEALDNIRASVNYEYPVLAPQPVRQGSAIFVAGGPTLRDFLPEIKRRKDAGEYVFTSNHTHDFLVKSGIIPNACLLFDPKEVVKDYAKLVNPDTAYMVSTCANPKVWETMKERGARMLKVMIAYGIMNESDMKLMNELYPNIPAKYYLPGGTMTPLRAWPLAAMLGFKKIEMYGFDSCFSKDEPRILYEGAPDFKSKSLHHTVYQDDKGKFIIDEPEDGGFFYAYKKPRRENIKVVEYQGRYFLSSQVFTHQAMQIPKWYDRLESQIEIVIHGDSLSSWVLGCHKKEIAEKKERVGDRRWTPEYEDQMLKMHEQGNFGIHGYTDIEWSSRAIISLLCTLQRPIKVLDYGAGAGTYAEAVHKVFKSVEVTSYDPFHPKFRNNPEPGVHDAVNCTDVLEHVELECVDNTLKFIADKARFMACFSIGLDDANKILPDGRNAHITQKSPKWWADKLREHFAIVDYSLFDGQVLFVCQPIDMTDRVREDGGYDRTDLGGRLRFAEKVGGK
jgi:hypothetical protein